ncbi:unnamed protein product, partial [marine sediment metagenome]
MKKIKLFLSRFKDKRGDFGTTFLFITFVGIVVFGVAANSFGNYAKEAKEKTKNAQITIDNADVPGDTSDINEAGRIISDTNAEARKKGLELGVDTVFDSTCIQTVAKKTGIYDVPKDKKEEQKNIDSSKSGMKDQENSSITKDDTIFVQGLMGAVAGGAEGLSIEEKLNENNLPADAITQDITKIVINVANQLGSSDSKIADIIDTSMDVIKDITNKDTDNDSSKTLEIIKEKLSEKNKLEDEEIINKRKEYNLSVLEKEQREKEIEAYKYYQSIFSSFKKEELTDDQLQVLSMLGYPDEYMIIFDEGNDNIRIEVWIFEAMQSSFLFEGGKYTSSEMVITPKLLPDNYNLRPEDFVYSMTPEEVGYLIGEDGYQITETNTGLKTIIYGEGNIVCTYNTDDLLVYVSRSKEVE